MYKCQNCETEYELTSKHIEHIGIQITLTGLITTIIICPACAQAIIVGGESDYSLDNGLPIVNMFSRSIEDEDLSKSFTAFIGKIIFPVIAQLNQRDTE